MFLDPRLRTEHRTVCRHLRGAVLSPIERSAGVIKHLTPRRVVKRVLGGDGSPQLGAVPAKRPRRRSETSVMASTSANFGVFLLAIFLCSVKLLIFLTREAPGAPCFACGNLFDPPPIISQCPVRL